MIVVKPTTARWTLGCFVVVGTIAWAASFALCDGVGALTPLAAAVGVSAGAAWATFGLFVLATTEARRVHDWIDLCLNTQTVGTVILLLAAVVNATFFATADWLGSKPVFPVFIVFHAGVLVLADLVMGTFFVSTAPASIGRGRALGAWVLGLNGTFALVLALLLNLRIFQ